MDALSHLTGKAMSSRVRRCPNSVFRSRESQLDSVAKPVTHVWEQRQTEASTAEYLPKKHINSALLYLRSASQSLTFSAPLLSADPYNDRGSILKAHQPLQLWQSISRRKAEFTWVFPREADVSLSQPIDYNGNIIKPQVYSCPERALISLVLEDLMKPNVFTTSISAVEECFYPCSQRKA